VAAAAAAEKAALQARAYWQSRILVVAGQVTAKMTLLIVMAMTATRKMMMR
jgi:hypothetical protein